MTRPVIETPEERINHLEHQLLVNSALYYSLGKSIISDELYDKLSFELAGLFKKYPKLQSLSTYYTYGFQGFVPDSGYYLDYNPFAGQAKWLYKLQERKARQKG